MKKEFGAFYALTPDETTTLWENATLVLDANVLLDLYRYPSDVRDALLTAFSAVADRIWIPHQAALEFQYNRPNVIAQQVNRFAEVRQSLEKHRAELAKSLDQLQLKKRHSTIDPDAFISQLDGVINQFADSLADSQASHPDVHTTDPIRDILDSTIVKNIGPAFDQAELDKIYEEGAKRYARQQPPGYEDAKQKEGEVRIWSDTIIRREYGDLILWKQLLRYASESKLTHVILITSDEKQDWWQVVRSNGPKKLGPRPELVQELTTTASVKGFQMYTSLRFLEHAPRYLEIEVPPTALERLRSFDAAERKLFSDLSNAKLREKTLLLVRSLRERLAQYHSESRAAHDRPTANSSDQERQESWERMVRESTEASDSLSRDYKMHFKIDALLLRDGLTERLGIKADSRIHGNYEHHANALCMGDVADDLESMAKQLP